MNRFQNLMVDTTDILPEPWYNYPVLKPQETIEVYPFKELWKKTYIYLAIQDGVWCMGYKFNGGGCYPGRKWGQFNTRIDAILYQLGEMEEEILNGTKSNWYSDSDWNKLSSAVTRLIGTYSPKQLKLF